MNIRRIFGFWAAFLLLFCASLAAISSTANSVVVAASQPTSISTSPALGVLTSRNFSGLAVSESNCNFGILNYIACPLSGGIFQMITDIMKYVVSDLLYMDVDKLFSPEFKTAWTTFQRLGFAIVIIAGLIMIISHALGFEIFDAYTIKKTLPRLIVALVGMALAWPVLKFIVTFFNDIGVWTNTLITKPFDGIGNDAGFVSSAGASVTEWITFLLAGLGAFIGGSFLGFAGILSLLATIALAVLIGVATLLVRQLVIMVCIIMAPIAIACYILPSTKKIANFWQNSLTTALMMYPIIMAFIASGEVMSRIAADASEDSFFMMFLSIIVYFIPYFILPMAFKMAGGLMGNIAGMTNDRSRGVFDRLRKGREEIRQRRRADYASGAKGNGLAAQWAARREIARQGGSMFGEKFREGHRQHVERVTRQKAEEDKLFALGDTDATAAAIHAGSREEFIDRMMAQGRSRQSAETAAARLQASLGADFGSQRMRLAAWQGHLADNTSYRRQDANGNWQADYRQLALDSSSLVEAGIISQEDAAGMMNNANRPEISKLGFSEKTNLVNRGRNFDANDQVNYRNMGYEVSRGAEDLMSHTSSANIQTSATLSRTQERLMEANNDGSDANIRGVIRQYAMAADTYDAAASASPQAAEIFGNGFLAQEVDVQSLPQAIRERLQAPGGPLSATLQNAAGQTYQQPIDDGVLTHRQIMEGLRNEPEFREIRREYGVDPASRGINLGQQNNPGENP